MPVILDNIQFYHGPSKPTKPPYFAFNSNQISSNTMVSGGQTAFTEPVSSPRDDSTMATACFLPPAANAVDTTHQHAVGSPNLFDFELARSWEVATPLLSPRDACDRDICFSPQKPDCHHQDSSDEKMPGDFPSSFAINSRKSTGLDDSGFFPRSRSSCTSPPPPSQSPSIAVRSPVSAISPPWTTQSHVVENVQRKQNRPSYCADSESVILSHTWGTSDVSTTPGQHSSNTPLSSILSISDAPEKQSGRGSCIPSPDDCPDDYSDDYEGESQTGVILDCSPRAVAEAGPSGRINPQHVNTIDLMDSEQAPRCVSVGSHPRTPRVQGDKNPGFAIARKKERPVSSTRKQDTAHEQCHSSFAVVIPPFRPRPARSVRSKPKFVPPDAYESESTESCDDSSDEDFTYEGTQLEPSDLEDSLGEKHGASSSAASCDLHGTSISSSTSHCESRDIVGRAILTIETQGSEPTFFFTLVPDNARSTLYMPAQKLPFNSEKPDKILKRSTGTARSNREKGKCRQYSNNDDRLLVTLKEEGRLTWDEITDHFPGRTSSALQVHYSTKLRHKKPKKGRPQSRRGKKKR